ncbi:hypothetical protein HA402_014994 [Bradysia odoriphaga]|nr:hypothetical protein HA402_014994 [Bradysia odoriphaga]
MALHWLGTLLLLCLMKLASTCNLVSSTDGTSCLELQATPYITTQNSEFGPTIEGASVNRDGDIFAVSYGNSDTKYQLGQVFPQQKLFYNDSNLNSFFNGIRFYDSESAFVADKNHRVLKLNVGPGNVVLSSEDFCADSRMIEPNDLVVSVTGTVYTSGMNWIDDTNEFDGDVWSCLPNGTVQRLVVMGRTNGIELTPDEKFLYVSESYNRGGIPYAQKIWKYSADVTQGTVGVRELFIDFEELDNTTYADVDGMKTDINGNLFVARYTYGNRGHVAIFSPDRQLIGKIYLSFPNPTNVEFGGADGKTLYIVGQCAQEGKGCVDRIEVNSPGRSWTNLQASSAGTFVCAKYKWQILWVFVYLLHFFHSV